MLLYMPTAKPVEQIKEEQTVDMGIWSEDNQGNSLAGKGDDIEHFRGN